MDRIVQEIATYIRSHVSEAVSKIGRRDGEIRTVFHGPPMEILRSVFDLLGSEGGIDAQLGNGDPVRVPVLLQVDKLEPGATRPRIGDSGVCDSTHLIDLRNAPTSCPRFVALIEPGVLSPLSFSSASDDFGLSPHNNSGTATTGEWWNDRFIQLLVARALDRGAWTSTSAREKAILLIEKAVIAADKVDKNLAARPSAWRVLSRIWTISDPRIAFGSQLSLACGFPPLEDGLIEPSVQEQVLEGLAERFVDKGFGSAIEELRANATSEEESALNGLREYVLDRCQVAPRFAHAPAYFYEPSGGFTLADAPEWWTTLTVEKWKRLLDGAEERLPDAALKLVCFDPVVPKVRGLGPVVADAIKLAVESNGELSELDEVTITREVGGAANRRQWQLKVGPEHALTDEDIPFHKTPIRYTVTAPQIKTTSIRIVSLSTWEPGVVVFSRTAAKVALPKQVRRQVDNVAYELSILLSGQGRHYVDVYVRAGVTLGEKAFASGDDGAVDENRQVSIRRVGDSDTYGFEIEVSGDCFYQFEVKRIPDAPPQIFRIYFSCDEAASERCDSEFERLIRLNRSRGIAKASIEVNMNRQHRCADLEGWLLTKDQALYSFRPFVLGTDYATTWRARDWSSSDASETIFSNGGFLHDPRPLPDEIKPPDRFLELRALLFDRLRGEEDNGLVEISRLGEWLVTDPVFAQLIEEYVECFDRWLLASPEIAAWSDIGIVASLEADGTTLVQEPDAILVSPLHPVRLAWHCLAQRALFLSQRKLPCPAASILDPDAVPDALVLPLRTASGGIRQQVFFSVECSSDYWSILWNGSKLDRLSHVSSLPPFDKDFGVLVGGVSSGFSASQVTRALDDISEIFSAKPHLNIAVSSAAGQNNACNEGLLSWCHDRFSPNDEIAPRLPSMGRRFVQIIDERPAKARPEEAEISNLAEDTDNAARWLEKRGDVLTRPDLTIIAQLETSNPAADSITSGSPLGVGGLIRHRVRQQLSGGQGAFLTESRMASVRGPTGDGLADKTAAAILRLENLGEIKYGYTFAPSVNSIRSALDRSDYAAVSSAAVDPACFLGGWLNDMYLWDYELPSYAHRSGDSNGYYLLSKVKALDTETLFGILSKLPGCDSIDEEQVEQMILEVARRGIPTVRGLSRGDSGASGDLGLFVASRLLQDDFRVKESPGSLIPILVEDEASQELAILVPIDPFRGYIDDLARAVGRPSFKRPDLLVAWLTIADSKIRCRLTPVEVKYRGKDVMQKNSAQEALSQAKAFSELLGSLQGSAEDPELVAWKLAFQHLLSAMLAFGLRVYSQQRVVANKAAEWAAIHSRIIASILNEEIDLEIDRNGRLIVVDGSHASDMKDFDEDGFAEAIVLSRSDAGIIVKGTGTEIYSRIAARIANWELRPGNAERTAASLETKNVSNNAVHLHSDTDKHIDTPVPTDARGAIPPPETVEIASTDTPLIDPLMAQTAGIRLLVGETVDGFKTEMRSLNLSDTNLTQLNVGVVGDLGTGKTQLLKSLVYQVVNAPDKNRGVRPRFLIFDYKKDYSSDDFVRAVNARVVKPHHLPINLFDVAGAGEGAAPWLDRFKFFADILDKIFSGVGPVQRQNLKGAVRQAYERCRIDGRQPTIYDVHSNYRAILGNKADSPLAIIDDLVDMEMFSPEPSSTEGVDKFLDGVVVISLDALGQDDRTKNMLVAIMLNMFYEHMLRIPKRPFVGESPQLRVVDSFLLVDEADNIMRYEFDVLRKILLQGREFGVGVILASQYLRHFKAGATDYREPLLSWFIHKVPNIVPQELGALGLAANVAQMSERIKALGKHECLFKTHDVPGEIVKGVPFYSLFRK